MKSKKDKLSHNRRLSLPVVKAAFKDDKSGCYYCGLMPFSDDFDEHRKDFKLKDPDRFVKRVPFNHSVSTRFVDPDSHEPVDVLFVADAPGAQEDREGEQFVGKTGDLIRKVAKQFLKSKKVSYAFTSIIRCRTPKGRDPGKTEIRACSPELVREIKKRKPKVIIPLGNMSLEFFMGRRGITHLQGRGMYSNTPGMEGVIIVPCLHPTYVLRNTWEIQKFVDAIELAGNFVTGESVMEDTSQTTHVLTTLAAVKKFVRMARRSDSVIAFDSETGDLSPHASKWPKLLCLSFATEHGAGVVIPLDHPESPWTLSVSKPRLEDMPNLDGRPKDPPEVRTKGQIAKQAMIEQWEADNHTYRTVLLASKLAAWRSQRKRAKAERGQVVRHLRRLFRDKKIHWVAQNGKFDQQHIRAAIGVEIAGRIDDTLLMHYTVDDRQGGHGLDVLAVRYTPLGGYDRPLADYINEHPECDPSKGGSYSNIPGDVLFPYAGADADVTRRVYYALKAEDLLRSDKQLRNIALRYFPRLSDCIADIEYQGAAVDLKLATKMRNSLRKAVRKIKRSIAALEIVQRFEADKIRASKKGEFEFNPGSDQQVGEILWGYCGLKPVELTETGEAVLVERWKTATKNGDYLSADDVKREAVRKQEWQFFSTKADVLNEYVRQGNKLAKLLLEYREQDKLLGTYFEPLIEKTIDGFIHGSFTVSGARTGRLSSRNPNLQNLPPEAKKVYISRFPGGIIVQADYSQIELRVACCLFHEPIMIETYRKGGDLHRVTAIALSGLSEAEYNRLPSGEQKEWRRRAKYLNFGFLYGGGPNALILALKRDGVFITYDDAMGMLEVFKRTYRRMFAAIEKHKAQATRDLRVRTFSGRIRNLPELACSEDGLRQLAERQCVNTVVQGGAAELTLMSLVLIRRRFREEGMQSIVFATVHDSICADCPSDEAIRAAIIMKEIMESIPKLSEKVLPGVDWSWLSVPIVAELEMGHTWYHAVPFDPDNYADDKPAPDVPLYAADKDGGLTFRAPVNAKELRRAMRLRHEEATWDDVKKAA